jgi:hypothetical protein
VVEVEEASLDERSRRQAAVEMLAASSVVGELGRAAVAAVRLEVEDEDGKRVKKKRPTGEGRRVRMDEGFGL